MGGVAAHAYSMPFRRVWVCLFSLVLQSLSPLGLSSSSYLEGHGACITNATPGRQVDTDTPCCFLNFGKAAGLSLGDIVKKVTFVSQWGFTQPLKK